MSYASCVHSFVDAQRGIVVDQLGSLLGVLFVSSLLAGCSVTGMTEDTQTASAPSDLVRAGLPPVASSSSEKFARDDRSVLGVADAATPTAAQSGSDVAQAFIDSGLPSAILETKNETLKPFVGRWSVNNPNVKSGGSLAAQGCMLVLEPVGADHGYRATGTSVCPTGLFMLDSWVPFGDRLVLRDYMGDEILKLSSRGPGMWVGVHKDGTTFVLHRS